MWHVRQCALKVAGTAICENEGGFWGKYCETSDEQFRFSDAPPPVMHVSAVSITGGLRCRPLPGKLMAYAALGQGAHPEFSSFSIERQSRAKHPLPACVLLHRVSERERRPCAVRFEWVETFENVMMNYTQLHAVGDQRGQ